jgi:methionyl-tRNA synthetase
MGKRYTITAALPYANGPLHLGHIAGVYMPADIFARFQRMSGQDVAFICGSDEHGAAITLRAKKEGISPQEIVDKYHGINKKAFEDLGISFDIYHRTSAPIHHQTAQDFFKQIDAQGGFDIQTSEQYFDEQHQQFLADRYITGECPKCQNPNAYGDQCEKCGSSLSPTELINPKSVLSGNTPKLKETKHWYLPMNKHEDWIKQWISEGILDGKQHHDPKEWKNHVLGQCMSWVDGGLMPRAMTRDLDWGVKVPVEGGEGKVLYVWLDAPIGYISATKAWAEKSGKNWEDYWKNEDTELVHFLAKDNIVFHCIIFPIILKTHGDYILPKNIPANEFLNLEGEKFSTSRNWAVWLHEYLADFESGQDMLRYVLCSIAPETKDAEFTWKDFQARVNNELVAIYGNFINRALTLTHKYYDGAVPEARDLEGQDLELLAAINSQRAKVEDALNVYKFRDALFEAMNLARMGNKYLADTEPWKLQKTDPERVKTIMNCALQVAANLSVIMEPFVPFSSKVLQEALGINEANWTEVEIAEGSEISKCPLLFQKIEDTTIEEQLEKLQANAAQNSNFPPLKDLIAFEDFTKLDIRTAKILSAEKHENADKLLVLKVDTGLDQRTVVSGIAQHYKPEDIVGKTVSILMNLAPRKIRGVESQGMILMAENDEEGLAFISPEKAMGAGSEIR